jgi:hypothetical protein
MNPPQYNFKLYGLLIFLTCLIINNIYTLYRWFSGNLIYIFNNPLTNTHCNTTIHYTIDSEYPNTDDLYIDKIIPLTAGILTILIALAINILPSSYKISIIPESDKTVSFIIAFIITMVCINFRPNLNYNSNPSIDCSLNPTSCPNVTFTSNHNTMFILTYYDDFPMKVTIRDIELTTPSLESYQSSIDDIITVQIITNICIVLTFIAGIYSIYKDITKIKREIKGNTIIPLVNTPVDCNRLNTTINHDTSIKVDETR